jgi:hypothetical protein
LYFRVIKSRILNFHDLNSPQSIASAKSTVLVVTPKGVYKNPYEISKFGARQNDPVDKIIPLL